MGGNEHEFASLSRAIRTGACVGLLLCALMPCLAGPVNPPQRVTFRLADAVKITGDLTAWDAQGIEGTFGRREWSDLNADDLWRLYRQLMDRSSAAQWVDLGGVMLLVPQGQAKAERAFAEAMKLDRSVELAIKTARQAAEEARQRRDQAKRDADAGKLRTRSPEAGPFPGEPWPELSAEQRAAAIQAVKAEAASILRDAGVAPFETIETDFYILHTQTTRLEAAQWGWQLDQTCRKLMQILGLPKESNVFAGKAAVFVIADREKFRQIETTTFNQLISDDVRAIVHYRGERTYLNLHSAADQADFGDLLSQKAALAFLHRYRSAVGLPAWANEGLAVHAASLVAPKSEADNERHRLAVEFMRGNGDVNALLSAAYADDAWATSGRTVGAVGGLIVELMLRERPEKFIVWVNAVKAGKHWETALKDDFGVPRQRLAEQAAAYFKVND